MKIARRLQRNLDRVGVVTRVEIENGVVFVRGENDSAGKPFNIRIRNISLAAGSQALN
jgi:hypothetical protein